MQLKHNVINPLATQLDPPAHWNPDYPATNKLPATYTLRPLVVIPIQDEVAKNPAYRPTEPEMKANSRF